MLQSYCWIDLTLLSMDISDASFSVWVLPSSGCSRKWKEWKRWKGFFVQRFERLVHGIRSITLLKPLPMLTFVPVFYLSVQAFILSASKSNWLVCRRKVPLAYSVSIHSKFGPLTDVMLT